MLHSDRKSTGYEKIRDDSCDEFYTEEKQKEEKIPVNEVVKTEEVKEIKEKTKEKPVFVNGVDYNITGQIFGTYIIVQKDNEMYIIDQHAACERVYFENLMNQYLEGGVSSQLLMIPVTVKLDPVSFALATANLDFLENLGFECDEFGDCDLIVRSVPDMMTESEIKDSITEIISLLGENKENIKKAIAEEALHTVACKKAIKGNSHITNAEMESLVESVLSFEIINTCPHGRPIMIKMTKYELEKQFKRIV
jgi:DNA mismatch repair protein MutL